MRRLLLDTCAVLWLANGELGRFTNDTLDAMRDAEDLCISPITEWEISLKWHDGGIILPIPPRRLLSRFMVKYGVNLAPLTGEVMFRATELPQIHRDPADRFIIATALTENMPVVTTDRRFPQYGVLVMS
jgi:PIN domain nuclease of toxin-antitoxin system